jgi:hypothetical protein
MSRISEIFKKMGIDEGAKEDVIAFIKKQISFDITPYIDDRHTTRKYLIFDLDSIPKDKQNAIKNLAKSYGKDKFRLEDSGGLGTTLYFSKDLNDSLNKSDLDDVRTEVVSSYDKKEMNGFKDFDAFFDAVDVQNGYNEEPFNTKKWKPFYQEIWNEFKAGKLKLS